jgi:hypothetical protein
MSAWSKNPEGKADDGGEGVGSAHEFGDCGLQRAGVTLEILGPSWRPFCLLDAAERVLDQVADCGESVLERVAGLAHGGKVVGGVDGSGGQERRTSGSKPRSATTRPNAS